MGELVKIVLACGSVLIGSSALGEGLEPEDYRKNPKAYEKALIELKVSVRDDKDRKQGIDNLVQNLSLNGDSVLGSARVSEEIRQFLVWEGVLDFKKQLGTVADQIKEHSDNKEYVGYAKQTAGLLRDYMFMLRWHHPRQVKGEIDFEKANGAYRAAFDDLISLGMAMKVNNASAVKKYLASYVENYTKAQAYFESDVKTLLKQAETEIGLSVIGTPLKKISYDGKEYIVTKGFSEDWEEAERIILNTDGSKKGDWESKLANVERVTIDRKGYRGLAGSLSIAFGLFKGECGRYPNSSEGFSVLLVNTWGFGDKWRGPYIRKLPIDEWGNPFVYEGDRRGFRVYSLGADGKKSRDDIKVYSK